VHQGAPHRYRSPDEDSARWLGFPFRSGDIVISTRSKCGTTWMQMICAVLVLGTPELPDTLTRLSPWLDWLVRSRHDVLADLAAQDHRRFIKTHTPLDGVPRDDRATYIVVARHPLDMAVSLYHHSDNINRERLRQLTGQPGPAVPRPPRPPLHDWVLSWITWEGEPQQNLDTLPGVMWHMRDAWVRRSEPNVVLVHYADLSRDLEGQMRRLATRLGISIDDDRWPELVRAATFDQMRQDSDSLAPDHLGVLTDRAKFFRQGTSGAGRALLTEDELTRYAGRVAALGPPDMLDWLHHGEQGMG
jgi:aryl sulfotransferase